MAFENVFCTSGGNKHFLKGLIKHSIVAVNNGTSAYLNFNEIISQDGKKHDLKKKKATMFCLIYLLIYIQHLLKSRSLAPCLQYLSDCTHNSCRMLFQNCRL